MSAVVQHGAVSRISSGGGVGGGVGGGFRVRREVARESGAGEWGRGLNQMSPGGLFRGTGTLLSRFIL